MDLAPSAPKVLVVDDTPVNLKILARRLEKAGYEPVPARDGRKAWEILEASPAAFDVVLLDRMMPEMDGMEVLARMKRHPLLSRVPVVLQTALASREHVLEGLEAGAYHYLTKPVEQETLLAVVRTAVTDTARFRALQERLDKTSDTLGLMEAGRFRCRTLEECRNLAALLATACPRPSKAAVGLQELLINAVEHGNLGITYEEKSRLTDETAWAAEVERRLALPENAAKSVLVEFERREDRVLFRIEDCGPGFDWQSYVEVDPSRLFDTHGRGIAMAMLTSFDEVEYRGRGNEVLGVVALAPALAAAAALASG